MFLSLCEPYCSKCLHVFLPWKYLLYANFILLYAISYAQVFPVYTYFNSRYLCIYFTIAYSIWHSFVFPLHKHHHIFLNVHSLHVTQMFCTNINVFIQHCCSCCCLRLWRSSLLKINGSDCAGKTIYTSKLDWSARLWSHFITIASRVAKR